MTTVTTITATTITWRSARVAREVWENSLLVTNRLLIPLPLLSLPLVAGNQRRDQSLVAYQTDLVEVHVTKDLLMLL